jgi:hypothetical protein
LADNQSGAAAVGGFPADLKHDLEKSRKANAGGGEMTLEYNRFSVLLAAFAPLIGLIVAIALDRERRENWKSRGRQKSLYARRRFRGLSTGRL